MGPEVAALAFAAAATGVAGAGYLSERSAARNQYTIDQAAIELQRQQSHFQAAEAANANAINYRKALASQVAIASMRGGSGSVVRQFGSESYGNFLRDQEAVKRGVRLTDVQALNQQAQARGERSLKTTNAAFRAIGSSLNAWNLNYLSSSKGGK